MREYDPAWFAIHMPEGAVGVMKFVLVWRGRLPASANKGKTVDVARIRAELSPQLAYLWDTHHALQVLKEYAWVRNPNASVQVGQIMTQTGPPTPRMHGVMLPGSMIDMCDWIPVDDKRYKPLVRKSLHLTCDLDILFLRQDEPGELITQGGDLDGRIKTLLDALRMPSKQEQDIAEPVAADIFCLMESDTLVSSMNVETERLLFPQSTHPHEVHLVIEISLRVLRVDQSNYCLL